jgi:hypothetical protein
MVGRKYLFAPLLLVLILLSPSCAELELLTGGSRGGPGPPPSGSLSVSFIDVGQGDAVLVQAGGESYLIDAGRPEEGPNVVDSCAAGASTPSTASWLQIPRFHRTPELRFRALLIKGASWQVKVGRP